MSIAELDPGRERRDVVVSVQEAPTTAVSWGVGYSEQDRLRGSVEVTRRNLGGLGRTASVFARGSFRGSRLLLNLREPWLFGRKLDSFVDRLLGGGVAHQLRLQPQGGLRCRRHARSTRARA